VEKTKVASMRGGCAATPEEIPSAQFFPVISGNFIPVMTTRLFPSLGTYGCKTSQDVCPWNVSFASELREPAFAVREHAAWALGRVGIASERP
jgi:hypothetical protein